MTRRSNNDNDHGRSPSIMSLTAKKDDGETR